MAASKSYVQYPVHYSVGIGNNMAQGIMVFYEFSDGSAGTANVWEDELRKVRFSDKPSTILFEYVERHPGGVRCSIAEVVLQRRGPGNPDVAAGDGVEKVPELSVIEGLPRGGDAGQHVGDASSTC